MEKLNDNLYKIPVKIECGLKCMENIKFSLTLSWLGAPKGNNHCFQSIFRQSAQKMVEMGFILLYSVIVNNQ